MAAHKSMWRATLLLNSNWAWQACQNHLKSFQPEKSSLVGFAIVDADAYLSTSPPEVRRCSICAVAQVLTKPSSLYNLVSFRPRKASLHVPTNNFLTSQCINIVNSLGSLQEYGQSVEALTASPLPADQHEQILTLRHHASHHCCQFLPTRWLTFWKTRATLVFSFKWTLLGSNYAIPEPLARTRLEASVKVRVSWSWECWRARNHLGKQPILSKQSGKKRCKISAKNTATTGAFSPFHSEGMPKRQKWISQRQDEVKFGWV